MVLGTDACFAATADPGLSNKQLKAAIRQAQHRQGPKGSQHNIARRNGASTHYR